MLAFLYRKVLCIVSTHLEVTFKSVGEPDNSVPHHTQRFVSTHSMTVLHPSVDVFCCCANSMFYRTCGHFRWCNFHIEVQPISCGHKLIKNVLFSNSSVDSFSCCVEQWNSNSKCHNWAFVSDQIQLPLLLCLSRIRYYLPSLPWFAHCTIHSYYHNTTILTQYCIPFTLISTKLPQYHKINTYCIPSTIFTTILPSFHIATIYLYH